MTRTLGMFPLSTVLFPHAGLPLHIFEDRYRTLMADCMGGDGEFGVVLITRGAEVGGGDQRVDLGTVARISRVSKLVDGRMMVFAQGVRRIAVSQWLPDVPYPRAVVHDLPLVQGTDDVSVTEGGRDAVRRVRSLLSELGDVPAVPHDLGLSGTAEEIGWQLCELAPLNLIDRQLLLSSGSLAAQMESLIELCDAMSEDVVSMLAGGIGG